jgi:glycosyltransferase involved in cell wall biosynthesis
MRDLRYLLVTHIPFTRNSSGIPVIDSLWARDLRALAKSMGPIRVAAPELTPEMPLTSWGPALQTLPESADISFRGLPKMKSPRPSILVLKTRRILRQEVAQADLVHTSNYFPPYVCLAYAHDLAVKLGKKTVFVITEDFYDMLSWEWVRKSKGLARWRRQRTAAALDRRARLSARTASLTMLHTPAVVARYRLDADNSIMIRHPIHEAHEVIDEPSLAARTLSLDENRPLRIATACRHSELKGLDLLVRAIALLRDRGIEVRATLYGHGPETPRLKELAASLGVADLVSLSGSLDNGEALGSALREADLFVMAHRTSDFGRSFFDAMAAGLPVVAFATPASGATVYNGLDGFLTPLDDIQGLAEHIAVLHRDRSLLAKAARNARRRALENTCGEWFRIRASWIQSLLQESSLPPQAADTLSWAAENVNLGNFNPNSGPQIR